MKLKSRFFLVLSLIFICSSCFQEYNDIKKAKLLYKAEKHKEAIDLLNQYDSKKTKELNSKIHQDLAVETLTNLNEEKELRYLNAKENLRKALDLDPENKEAKVFYKMLSKTIDREFPSGL
ncbi:MAG: hypothetical protein MK033_08105 [Candidatus Caenarcaniphilales bacterium]|nr:hypothetical protein [Candidatus Caenarcaniphilales bacterium]